MKKLIFEGYGNGTFGESNHFEGSRQDEKDGRPISFLVQSVTNDSSFYVIGQYDSAISLWAVGVRMDYGHAIPRWPIRIIQDDCVESPTLCIEAPDDVTVKLWVEGEEPVESDNE